MRILTRYILREVISYALLGGVLFTFVLFISRLGKILEIIVRNSASLSEVAHLIAYFLPEAQAEQFDLHPCAVCGAPTSAEVCAFCRLVDRAGGSVPTGDVVSVRIEFGATRHGRVPLTEELSS